MQINYLILAHNQANQLKRLLETLDGSERNFFIHIDADADINAFKAVLGIKQNVHFLPDKERMSIKWADFSMVQATLNLMKLAANIQKNGFCVLLSGQDYPLKSNAYLDDFFGKNMDSIFIEGFSIPTKGNWGHSGGLDRLELYHFVLDKKGYKKSLESIFNRNFWKMSKFWDLFDLAKHGQARYFYKLLKKRTFPSYLKPYGGSQWWSMPMSYVMQLLDFLKAHPDYIAYHKFTLCPDEIFFHSLCFSLFPKQVQNSSTTYVNWIRPVERPPVVFNTKDDLEELMQCGKLFARKFDERTSGALLDIIDLNRRS